MRILFLGDTHGNLGHFALAVKAAHEYGCEVIWQLGDNGFVWGGSTAGLDEVQKLLGDHLQEFWIDGNHEDFHTLARLGIDPNNELPTRINNTVYFPRGYRYELDGIRFMTFGGAVSMDKEHRHVGVSWFWEEEFSSEQLERACSAGKIDVLLSHDAPYGMQRFEASLGQSAFMWTDERLRASFGARQAIRQVVDACRPDLVIHGHYHHRHTDYVAGTNTKVIGLNCDGHGEKSWLVFDTESYKASGVKGVRQ